MPEPRRWTLYDVSAAFNPRWRVEHETAPRSAGYLERVEVMPVEEHEQAMATLQDELDRLAEVLDGSLEREKLLEAELAKAREITPAMLGAAVDALHAIRFCSGADTCEALTVAQIVLRAALGLEGRDDG